jgi:hypothetical protein
LPFGESADRVGPAKLLIFLRKQMTTFCTPGSHTTLFLQLLARSYASETPPRRLGDAAVPEQAGVVEEWSGCV